jgi:hypothetical protein
MNPGDLQARSAAPLAPRRIDVCNGDADGLCAVLQWRLHQPAPALLVTGLKRDIALLDRVSAGPGDEVLVCDISMQRNRAALLRLLGQGARVRYFDHHRVDDLPAHPLLESHIDMGAKVCTSLLMDRHLGGAFRAWAWVGAYGDNLGAVADAMATAARVGARDRAQLRSLGEAINYNAYGEDANDVRISPAQLFEIMARHADPLEFMSCEPIAEQLVNLRRADLRQATALSPHVKSDNASIYLLPDAPWSRRVIGALANELASGEPEKAHAVLKPMRTGGYVASVRAPLTASAGADVLCGRFGGSGRAASAGIDHLAEHELPRFIREFGAARWEAR